MPSDLSRTCFTNPIFERSRNDTTYINIRKGTSRLTVREVARFKVESEVSRAASGRFNAGLLGGLNSIQSEMLLQRYALQGEDRSVSLIPISIYSATKRPGEEAGPFLS